ncbi:hypothetical protein CS369_03375 [Candidatus Symbiopectobacterium sp. 'North America']|nr:hypothetical protein [Candidatus Symbiopectobacterium sp. 'North America']
MKIISIFFRAFIFYLLTISALSGYILGKQHLLLAGMIGAIMEPHLSETLLWLKGKEGFQLQRPERHTSEV